MRRVRRLTLTGLIALGVSGGGLLLGGPPALASYGLQGSFGSASSIPPNPEPLLHPAGVAVSEVGADASEVYVVDQGHDCVEVFNAAGEYVFHFDGSATPAHSFAFEETEPVEGGVGAAVSLNGVAVDNSTNAGDPSKGDVYVIDTGHDAIDKFSATGVYEGQLTEREGGPFEGIGGVAVDKEGNVWVLEYTGARVDEFNDKGELVVGGGFSDEYGTAHGIVLDAEGNVYVARGPLGSGFVEKWTFNGIAWSNTPFLEGAEGRSTSIAVDRASGDIYLYSELYGAISEYSPLRALVQMFGQGDLLSASDLAVDTTTGAVYIADAEKGDVDVFKSAEKPPPPITEEPLAASVEPTTAALRGELDPNGPTGELEYRFDYNTGASCLGGANAPVPAGEVAEGKEAHVEVEATGLQPATEYRVCVIAINAYGETVGSEVSFTTLPVVGGLTPCTASGVSAESATIEASLEPDGFLTKYDLEYGTSTSYGAQTEVEESAGGSGAVGAQAAVTGLQPNKTYDCRLAAIREIEGAPYTALGENGTFKTLAIAPAIPIEPAIKPAFATAEAASVIARVNPENLPTTFYFQYALNEDFEGLANENTGYDHATGEETAGEGYGAVFVSAYIEGLRTGTTYRLRVVAHNEAGTTYEPAQTFTTGTEGMPVVSASLGGVTQTGAVLSGTVNPEGYATSYAFEIGPSVEYGTRISGELAAGAALDSVSATLTWLAPGTTYHYRLVATNTKGTTYGEDETFTTESATTPVPAPVSSMTLTQPPTAPLLATPSIAFPTETGTVPATKTEARKLTNAQKLAKALKACRGKDDKHMRTICERKARKRYGLGPSGRRR